HLGNLHGGALVHVQGDFRILANEGSDHGWQGIAGLGMSGRNGQAALTLVAELLRNLLNAFDLTQNLSCSLEDSLACRSDAGQMLTTARKDLYAQFVFQQADLLADPGLGCVQALGRSRHVQVVMSYFPYITELLQLHKPSRWPLFLVRCYGWWFLYPHFSARLYKRTRVIKINCIIRLQNSRHFTLCQLN